MQRKSRKPTNARTCACGETVFAYTSLFCVAIVDAGDGWLLHDYKWNAQGKSLDGPFYVWSKRYGRETGNSALLHRAIMDCAHTQYDHVNGNGHDCRKLNLRPCTNGENMRNRKKPWSGLLSKYKGVKLVAPNTWYAQIRVDGQLIHLGTFGFEVDAAIAYNYHAAHYFGEFAKLNRITEAYPHD